MSDDKTIMKCGEGIFAHGQNKGDSAECRSLWYEKEPQPISPASAYFINSKNLARHGVIPKLSDDNKLKHRMAYDKYLDPVLFCAVLLSSREFNELL
ncbi:Biotin synthase [Dirofilaria immitis]